MEGDAPFQRSSPIQEKMGGGAGEAVGKTTCYFHSYVFLKLKEMSVLFTSIIAPKFKTTGSLAKVYVLILLEE